MKLSKLATLALITAAFVAPLSQSAHAGGSLSLTFKAKNEKQERAVRSGLFIYKLVQKKKGNAVVSQDGNGNAAGIAQTGTGHTGIVHQDGDGHTGTINQCGNNNAHGLFQFGKETTGHVSQCGHGEAGATVQIGF